MYCEIWFLTTTIGIISFPRMQLDGWPRQVHLAPGEWYKATGRLHLLCWKMFTSLAKHVGHSKARQTVRPVNILFKCPLTFILLFWKFVSSLMCVCLYYVLVCRRIHNGVLPSFVFFSLSFFFIIILYVAFVFVSVIFFSFSLFQFHRTFFCCRKPSAWSSQLDRICPYVGVTSTFPKEKPFTSFFSYPLSRSLLFYFYFFSFE